MKSINIIIGVTSRNQYPRRQNLMMTHHNMPHVGHSFHQSPLKRGLPAENLLHYCKRIQPVLPAQKYSKEAIIKKTGYLKT